MARNRPVFSAEFKAKAVLELISGDSGLMQASWEYGIKDTLILRWKQGFLAQERDIDTELSILRALNLGDLSINSLVRTRLMLAGDFGPFPGDLLSLDDPDRSNAERRGGGEQGSQ